MSVKFERPMGDVPVELGASSDVHPRGIVVVVPVYRDVHLTQVCLRSVCREIELTPGIRLLVVNDASPELGMADMLTRLAGECPCMTILTNPRNLGFVYSANLGFRTCDVQDVLLLNSDAILTPGAIGSLLKDAQDYPLAATITPLSNNAEHASFPRPFYNAPPPEPDDFIKYATAFAAQRLPCVEVPTGVGFCMLVRRRTINEIGGFDENAFGLGYGEENDFCQRAILAGWKNLISPNAYVVHKGSVSFGESRVKRVHAAQRILVRRHPKYLNDLTRFLEADPLYESRWIRRLAVSLSGRTGLFVQIGHGLGGGVAQHIEELVEVIEPFAASVIISPKQGTKAYTIGFRGDSLNQQMLLPNFGQVRELIETLAKSISVVLHFHHFIGLDDEWYDLPSKLGLQYRITVHDFYMVAGNPTLTNESGVFERLKYKSANNPLYPMFAGLTKESWRKRFDAFLAKASIVVFPSPSAKEIFCGHYDGFEAKVMAHPERRRSLSWPTLRHTSVSELRIGVFGALGKEKGADLLERCAKTAVKLGLSFKFVLLGYAYRRLVNVQATGAYDASNLPSLANKLELDLVLFPAQWPETYSYTLSQAFATGLPVLAPNIGAFADRVPTYSRGMLYPYPATAEEIVNNIVELSRTLQLDPKRAEPFTYPPNEYDASWAAIDPDSPSPLSNRFDQARLYGILGARLRGRASRRESLLKILWQVYTHPVVGGVFAAVPYRLRKFMKRKLSRRSIQEIILDK